MGASAVTPHDATVQGAERANASNLSGLYLTAVKYLAQSRGAALRHGSRSRDH